MNPLLSAIWLVPLVTALGLVGMAGRKRARAVALAGAATTFGLAVALFLYAAASGFTGVELVAGPTVLGLRYHVGVDGLSAVMLPATAGLALAALVAAPRAEIDAAAAARVLATEAGLLGCLVSLDLGVFGLFWLLSLAPAVGAVRRSVDHVLGSIVWLASTGSVVLLAAAIVALGVHGARAGLATPLDLAAHAELAHSAAAPSWVGVLVLLAALVRMGVFPLHAWVPLAVERGPVHLVVVAWLTPLGCFLVARVVFPLFPELLARSAPVLLALGMVSAIYGALLAVGQHQLRRLLGFIAVSQAGFVLLGMASADPSAMVGALLQSVASAGACAGLILIAAAIEARAATADMRRLGGIVRRAPFMASLFLLLAVAAVGFPGTVLFVSEDLLVQGLLREHALFAATLLVVTAVNGVTLVRAFKRTFLGPGARHADDLGSFEDLLPRERWVITAIVVALVAGGFAAAPLLALRQGVPGAAQRAPASGDVAVGAVEHDAQ